MVGTNIMELNEATMLAALNCYFDTIYKVPMKAVSVDMRSGSGGNYSARIFNVTVKAEDVPIPAVGDPISAKEIGR